MSNFIGMVYATLKSEGIDTKDMDTDEAVEKFKELQEKSGGKVGENEGTPAEQKRLRELGVEKDDFENSEKKEYKKLKSFSNYLNKNNEILKNILLDENKWLGSVGTEPQMLKDVLEEIGYLSKPKVVDKSEFEKLKQNGAMVLYRGVKGITNANSDLRDSQNPFIGRGAKLHGMYFSNDYEVADSYTKGQGSVVQVILNSNAHIISIESLENIDNENRMDIITGNISDEYNSFDKTNILSYFDEKRGRTREAIEAAMLGYDAVDMGHGNIVILNRGALIMEGEKNEISKFK